MFVHTLAAVQFATDCCTISLSSIRSNQLTQRVCWACPETLLADNPEQNEVVERKFQTLYGARSALNGARLPKDLRNGQWVHCADTMTKLENLLVDQQGVKCPYEMFDSALPIPNWNCLVISTVHPGTPPWQPPWLLTTPSTLLHQKLPWAIPKDYKALLVSQSPLT